MKTRASAKQIGLVPVVSMSLLAAVAAALLVVGSAQYWKHARPVADLGAATVGPVPRALRDLLTLSPDRIQQMDVALVNLLCAQGLPGTEGLDVSQCLGVLDQWAERVKAETVRHLYRFRANPSEFEYSEGYFRMLMMAVVVYEDFGVRYNPQRIALPSVTGPDDHFFADSRDIFLYGLLGERRMGTCSSMPVLYLAIGRRLSYPLKLATTKNHLFLRWEDGPSPHPSPGSTGRGSGGERFDLEATGKGMNRYDDAHFKQWPFPLTEEECRAEGYLKSLSPAEELAVFLSLRGNCLREAGQLDAAAVCYAIAIKFAPGCGSFRVLLASVQDKRNPGGARPWVETGALRPSPGVDPVSGKPLALPDPNPLRGIR
jgi:hypothetical protein